MVGGLGIGKTSLAKAFNTVSGFNAVIEQGDDLKHLFFVKEYLSNPEKFAFEGGLNFTAFHLNRTKERLSQLPPGVNVVTDAALIMQYAYAKDCMTPEELDVFTQVLKHSYKKLPKVDLRVVPQLSVDVHMARVNGRGRETEQSIPRAFFESMQRNVADALKVFGDDVPTVVLDAEQYNWAKSPKDMRSVMKIVARTLG